MGTDEFVLTDAEMRAILRLLLQMRDALELAADTGWQGGEPTPDWLAALQSITDGTMTIQCILDVIALDPRQTTP